MMLDPESFLDSLRGKRIVLDEIHRLQNPSELLKIAADYHSRTHIVATGSSTLGASKKFRDTLAGRKRDLWLAPMCLLDMDDANQTDLKHRFLRGGLPPFFLPEKHPERDFQEWMDAYWAKDIQELFRLERRDSFQRFTELVMAQSGGIFEATQFARPCEVSRPTIANYLRVLEATFVAHVVRPFSTRRPTEIVAAPKVYGFDTGFICYYRGWQDLRDDDVGTLWEHFVLNEIMARSQTREVFYWRDKRGHEVDFVIATNRKRPAAIECKWSANNFDPTNLVAFRHQHPEGDNIVLAHDVERAFTRNYGDLRVRFDSVRSFADSISS
jgi:predicted AAA+ superfamily ATPase